MKKLFSRLLVLVISFITISLSSCSKREQAPIEAYLNPIHFSCGRAVIFVDNKYGYIDQKGEIVIPCVYQSARNFSEGYAVVSDTTGLTLYIDTNGQSAFTGRFEQPGDVHDGMASFVVPNDGKYFFNIKTKEKFKINYDTSYDFSDGMAKVGIGEFLNYKYGFIDKTGKLVVSCKYDEAENFSEGLAAVGTGKYPNLRYGYVDKEGNMVIEQKYVYPGAFHEGLACVKVPNNNDRYLLNLHSSFIDKQGNTVLDNFDSYEGFKNGYAVVSDSKYGIIDIQGNMVCNYKYDLISSFDGNYGVASLGNENHIIDNHGKIVCGSIGIGDVDYSEELFCIKQGAIWIVKDIHDKVVLPLHPEDAPQKNKLPEAVLQKPNRQYGSVTRELGGQYPYSDGELSITLNAEGGNSSATINYEEEYAATINNSTGEIRFFDEEGRVIFSGYIYDYSVLAGNYAGKDIALDGMFGL